MASADQQSGSGRAARLFTRDFPGRLALLALLVGIVAGFGAVGFRALIGLIHNAAFLGVLSGHYDANHHTPPSPWGAGIILIPVAGALVVAFLVKTFAPEAKGHGVPEVMDAIYYSHGIIRPVVAAIKALASSASIGTGGSIGREGPIIQIGASFASSVSQILPMPVWQRHTLIAAGAGGGIAATFNTPIGGLLFAVELILPEVGARTLIPTIIATSAATFVGRAFFGLVPAFNIPALAIAAPHETPPEVFIVYIALGLLLGLASVVFVRGIYGLEDLFDRMPGNYYSRHATGMLLVGGMMFAFHHFSGQYYIEGVGYATVQDVLTGTLHAWPFLLLLYAAKLLATSLTLGSGASGGIFSPSLFMGSTLGGAYALIATAVAPGLPVQAPSMAVVGMAGMVGGATGAVVTSIVMIFEMTRDYNVIIPLMIVASLSYGVRRFFLTDSIYTMKLSRRGHFIPQALHTNWFLSQPAGEVIATRYLVVAHDARFEQVSRLARGRVVPHVLLVEAGRVVGALTARGLARARKASPPPELAAEAAEPRFVVVAAGEELFDVLARMRGSLATVALVTRDGSLHRLDDVVGVLARDEILQLGKLPPSARRWR